MKYYIVRMRDDALIGRRSGVQSSTCMTEDGYASEEEAYKHLLIWSRRTTTNVYFKIVKSETLPVDWEKRYEFKDFDIF